MDSFEFNKIAGALLFAFLIILGSRTRANIIFATHAPDKPGYVVEIEETEKKGKGTDKAAADAPKLAALLPKADAGKGKKVAKKCAICHSFDKGGKTKAGPNLYGIVNKALGQAQGFAYSSALEAKGGDWSFAALDAFVTNPKAYMPGTKMAFPGIKKPGQRAQLLMYLRGLSDAPVELPKE